MIPNVRGVTLTGYLEVSSYLGIDPYALLRQAHITQDTLSDPESRISAQTVCSLLEESARASNCATFGLSMAECRTFPSLGPVSLLLEHLGTMHEVVDAMTEYRRHLNDVLIMGVDEGDSEDVLRVELLAKYATPQTADLAIGVVFTVLSGASRFRWRPLGVHFSHKSPDDPARYRRFFGHAVEFGCTFNGFSCSRRSMTSRWPWANEMMADHARHLLGLVQLTPERSAISDRVMRIITLALPSGRATLSNVAAHLGKSPRTLQRSLAQEGRCFAELLNEVRRSVVVQQLSSNDSSMTSVAELLGFFTSSSFSRWFVSEFGVSPRTWRAEQMRSASTSGM